jgi:hypothetical protein
MSFNMWQKLMAASTENAVVAACCEAVVAVDALTVPGSMTAFEKPSRAAARTPRSRAGGRPL